MQNQLHQTQQFFCIAMEKAKVAHPPESFGENVLQNELQKIFAFEGAITNTAGPAFSILESDPTVLVGNDIFFAYHAPV